MQVEQRQHLVIFGDLRAHGGKIAEENRTRSPVSGSRRSFTRGALTATATAEVNTPRGSWVPLRTASRRPASYLSDRRANAGLA